jgi:hypothetical protein
VLAEGIETEAHGKALIEFGCEFGQGYAIARPMPAANVTRWMSQWHTPTAWAKSEAVGLQDIPTLLAEVEHRGWLKQIHAYVTRHSMQAPPLAHQACRFGQWLAKPSTRRHHQLNPDFAVLELLHEKLHAQARQLTSQMRASDRANFTTELLALNTLSEEVLVSLRKLRQTQGTSPWSDSRPDAY